MMNEPATKTRKKSKRRIWLILLLILLVLTWLAPSIIARTALRDRVLNAIIDNPDWNISSKSASFGWLTPLTINDLEIQNSENNNRLQIGRLEADRSWFSLWLAKDDFGSFVVDRAKLVVTENDAEEPAADSITDLAWTFQNRDYELLPKLTAEIRQAHVIIRNQNKTEPVIDIDGIDLTVHLTSENGRSYLELDPFQVFDHQELTREICTQGLQLVYPVLAEEVDVRGSISAELNRVRVPLTVPRDEIPQYLAVEGKVQFHEIDVQIKNSVTQRLARMLANLMGIQNVPDEWKLAQDADIHFEVAHGKVRHKSATMLLPDISENFALQTSGSVTIEEEVDMLATIKLPSGLLGESQFAKKVAATPIRVLVFGTIGETKIGLPGNPKWIFDLNDDLLATNLSAVDQTLADRLIRLIDRLYKNSADRNPRLPPQIKERISASQ